MKTLDGVIIILRQSAGQKEQSAGQKEQSAGQKEQQSSLEQKQKLLEIRKKLEAHPELNQKDVAIINAVDANPQSHKFQTATKAILSELKLQAQKS